MDTVHPVKSVAISHAGMTKTTTMRAPGGAGGTISSRQADARTQRILARVRVRPTMVVITWPNRRRAIECSTMERAIPRGATIPWTITPSSPTRS